MTKKRQKKKAKYMQKIKPRKDYNLTTSAKNVGNV